MGGFARKAGGLGGFSKNAWRHFMWQTGRSVGLVVGQLGGDDVVTVATADEHHHEAD